MSKKGASDKQLRADAYNYANLQLKGAAIKISHMLSELPYLESRVESKISATSHALWELRNILIEHQKKLIDEDK